MFSKTRKPLSLVLVLVMALTLVGINPAQASAATNSNPTGKDVECTVFISTPYQEYYDGYGYVNLTDYAEDSDLTDDFGIGLPTDGSDGLTALRAIAKYIRNYLQRKDGIYNPTQEQNTEYNSKLVNYIGSGAVSGFPDWFSTDGVSKNQGATKEGVTDTNTGYWMFYVNGKQPHKADGITGYTIADYLVSANDEIELVYQSYIDPTSYTMAGYAKFDKDNYYVGSNKKATVKVNSTVYDANYNPVNTVDKGATVEVINTENNKSVCTATTDSKGQATLPKLSAGYYKLVATHDIKTADGAATISSISRATSNLQVVKQPGKPKNVKAKVSGKSKKKTIKITWKNFSGYDVVYNDYEVYVSKKKSSGYKKAGTVKRGKQTLSFKKTKGTYYVKVRAVTLLDVGPENDMETFSVEGAFTAPVKVKVK